MKADRYYLKDKTCSFVPHGSTVVQEKLKRIYLFICELHVGLRVTCSFITVGFIVTQFLTHRCCLRTRKLIVDWSVTENSPQKYTLSTQAVGFLVFLFNTKSAHWLWKRRPNLPTKSQIFCFLQNSQTWLTLKTEDSFLLSSNSCTSSSLFYLSVTVKCKKNVRLNRWKGIFA